MKSIRTRVLTVFVPSRLATFSVLYCLSFHCFSLYLFAQRLNRMGQRNNHAIHVTIVHLNNRNRRIIILYRNRPIYV